MRIYHLSAECYPIAKVGGLADVVGALPKYQNLAGMQAAVVIPYYNRKFVQENEFDVIFEGSSLLGHRRYEFEILKERTDKLGFELFLIRVPGLLDRENIYSYPDEREQFMIFQLAFLDWITWSQQKPDIIHCHDHHTGLIPFLMQHSALYKRLSKVPSVFTIHNGQYHGAFGYEKFIYLPEIDMSKAGLLDWSGGINPLAAAVKCCWRYTAVSPSYLKELEVQSNGLESLFAMERDKGLGIINGIDTQVWNPLTDKMIPANYDTDNFAEGKLADKKALCERFGLSPDLPLVSFIGRLVVEKGADLLADAIKESIDRLRGQINFLILGTGDQDIEEQISELAQQEPVHFKMFLGYDEQLSHQIYAGSDFLLMPSRVEPCGLNQLYALRYGTIPVVRSTGGLKDTVIDFNNGNGYGIRFEDADVAEIVEAVNRSLVLYHNNPQLQLLRNRMMGLDFSWEHSASEYINLYKSLKPTI